MKATDSEVKFQKWTEVKGSLWRECEKQYVSSLTCSAFCQDWGLREDRCSPALVCHTPVGRVCPCLCYYSCAINEQVGMVMITRSQSRNESSMTLNNVLSSSFIIPLKLTNNRSCSRWHDGQPKYHLIPDRGWDLSASALKAYLKFSFWTRHIISHGYGLALC